MQSFLYTKYEEKGVLMISNELLAVIILGTLIGLWVINSAYSVAKLAMQSSVFGFLAYSLYWLFTHQAL